MSGKYRFQNHFESKARRKARYNYSIEQNCNEITERHPEAVAILIAGVGLIVLCVFLAFGISEIKYRYRINNWIEYTAVVDETRYTARRSGQIVECHYEIDGETRYAKMSFVNNGYRHMGDTITIYLNPSNKYEYIGNKGISNEMTTVWVEIVLLAAMIFCFYSSYNAYTKHYIFNGVPRFSQRMAELGIDTTKYDDDFYR